jgi:hypothetical protein
MQHDPDRRIALARRMIPAFDAASRAGEDDFRHESDYLNEGALDDTGMRT